MIAPTTRLSTRLSTRLGIALITPLLAPFIAVMAQAVSTTTTTLSQSLATGRFADSQNHWAGACINGMAAQGLMQGYPNGSFQPEGTMTRAEFAAVIVKAYPAPSVQSAPNFIDVPQSFWAKGVIQQAYERGYLAGYPNRQFRPNQTITRAQALTILAQAEQLTLPAETDDILMRSFDDHSAIPNYARSSIAATTAANLVVNYPKLSELRPQAAIARGEVAALLCQARSTSLEAQYRVPPEHVVPFNAEDNHLWQQATLLKEFSGRNQVNPIDNVAVFQNKLFFFSEDSARADASNVGLWVSDGTAAGTQLVKEKILGVDANGQLQNSFPTFMGASAQRLWFTTELSASANLSSRLLSSRLWSSDGTTAGTSPIALSTPDLTQADLTQADLTQALEQASRLDAQPNVFLNENFIFSLVTPTETQLWQSDGRSNSRRLGQFPNTLAQPGLFPGLFTSTGKQLFFARYDSQSNSQLWRSDGGAAVAVKTLNPAGEPFTPWGDRVYMEAETPQAGWEFWASNGTPSGTVLLKDIYPGPESSAPRLLTGLGSTVFALANSPQGFELWSTQGTAESTRLVKRLSSLASGRAETVTFVHQGQLFFSFPSPRESGYELWVTDGTANGTQALAKFSQGTVEGFTTFKDRLFFSGGGPSGQELWSTDGTARGTQQVIDLAPGTTTVVAPCLPPNPQNPTPSCPPPFEQQNSSLPRDLTVQGDWLYFMAKGRSLYRTDGTAQGTERIKQFKNTNSARPNRLIKVNQRLLVITEVPMSVDSEGSGGSDRLQIWSLGL